MKEHACLVCNEKAEQLCGRCLVVRYCSREHQKEHWKTHKTQCFPCRIEVSDKIGRHLIASRDIKAGETIFTDPPLVVGPQSSTRPVCLGCNVYVDGEFHCESCGFPLCGPTCASKINHLRECEMIQMGDKKAVVKIFDQVNPMYQCITPLRCLWMKLKAKHKWEKLMSMEDHLDERKKSGRCQEVTNFVVNIIRNYFQLDMFEEEEIQKVCGILETNGFEVPEVNMVALYGFGYLLEHSCVPNTTRTLNASLQLVLSAAVDIKAGDHITTSYVNPFWNERIRNVHLLKFKYFECSCPRCLDPTDLGTHLSSVKCRNCAKGLMPPPKSIIANWTCGECGASVDACEVEKLLVQIYNQKERLPPTVSGFEKFLKETRRTLSETHQYRTEVKLTLLQMYGKSKEKPLHKISEDEIVRKRNWCNELLDLVSVLSPGLSRIRGIILYELQSTYTELYRRLHKKFKNSAEGKEIIEKVEEILNESIQILSLETHMKEEMEMVVECRQQLCMVKKWKNQNQDSDTNLVPSPLDSVSFGINAYSVSSLNYVKT